MGMVGRYLGSYHLTSKDAVQLVQGVHEDLWIRHVPRVCTGTSILHSHAAK